MFNNFAEEGIFHILQFIKLFIVNDWPNGFLFERGKNLPLFVTDLSNNYFSTEFLSVFLPCAESITRWKRAWLDLYWARISSRIIQFPRYSTVPWTQRIRSTGNPHRLNQEQTHPDMKTKTEPKEPRQIPKSSSNVLLKQRRIIHTLLHSNV